MSFLLFFVGFVFCKFPYTNCYDLYSDTNNYTNDDVTGTCPEDLRSLEWLIHSMVDYNWGKHTHRAVIALAVNDFFKSTEYKEKDLIALQLEIELTKLFLRDNQPLDIADLSLYINAFVATGKDPRDFHGVDLVEMLRNASRSGTRKLHPFSVLTLCNAGDVQKLDLQILEQDRMQNRNNGPRLGHNAILVQAYACAVDYETNKKSGTIDINFYTRLIESIVSELENYEKDYFGNLYTTSLVMQAFAAANSKNWDTDAALDYLKSQRTINRNVVSTYYIEMALNANKFKFLKYVTIRDKKPTVTKEGFRLVEDLLQLPKKYYVQYTIRVGRRPELYTTKTIRIPSNISFFDVMRICAYLDPKFNFSFYMNIHNEPMVYAISSVPNDAEHCQYWRLIRETDVDHDRHHSSLVEIHQPLNKIEPVKDSHWIFWFYDLFTEVEKFY